MTDLYSLTFPHGTPDGYNQGCKGNRCEGELERTCAEAIVMYRGDYTYRRRVQAGLTLDQILEAERVDAATEKGPARSKTKKRNRATNPNKGRTPHGHGTPARSKNGCTTIEECPEHAAGRTSCVEARRAYDNARHTPKPAKEHPLHGTAHGYAKGCRLRDQCPAALAGGISCKQARAQYAQRYNINKPGTKHVPAAPAINHIKQLREAGMSVLGIGKQAGVPRSTIRKLVYGLGGDKGAEMPNLIAERNVEKILALAVPGQVAA